MTIAIKGALVVKSSLIRCRAQELDGWEGGGGGREDKNPPHKGNSPLKNVNLFC